MSADKTAHGDDSAGGSQNGKSLPQATSGATQSGDSKQKKRATKPKKRSKAKANRSGGGERRVSANAAPPVGDGPGAPAPNAESDLELSLSSGREGVATVHRAAEQISADVASSTAAAAPLPVVAGKVEASARPDGGTVKGQGDQPAPSRAASIAVTTVAAPSDAPPPSDVQQHLYEIQRNLDRLLRDVGHYQEGPTSRRRAAEALNMIASQFMPPERRASIDVSQVRTWASPDQWARHIGRFAMRYRSDEVDDFGLDRTYESHVLPLLELLFERYFRAQVDGLHHLPAEGRALLVCNRGGALPWDGLMLKMAIAKHHPHERELRWLLEDTTYHAPFLGPLLARLGAARACPQNAERLLADESMLAVFPEGINGVSKLYKQRYKLQRFGRGGAVKLALRMQAPVIPVAVVGAEDAYPLLYRLGGLSRLVGLPFLPVTPTFPLLGPVGLLPLPSRFVILAGSPIAEVGEYGPEAAEDESLVHELNERLRHAVQELVDQAVSLRGERVYS